MAGMIAGLVVVSYAAVLLGVIWKCRRAAPTTPYELHRERFIRTGDWDELTRALDHMNWN